MQQGIKKLQWFEYFKVVFLEILNAELCRVFANHIRRISISRLQGSSGNHFLVDHVITRMVFICDWICQNPAPFLQELKSILQHNMKATL